MGRAAYQRLQASLLTLPTPSGRGNADIEERVLGCWGLQVGAGAPPPLPVAGGPLVAQRRRPEDQRREHL